MVIIITIIIIIIIIIIITMIMMGRQKGAREGCLVLCCLVLFFFVLPCRLVCVIGLGGPSPYTDCLNARLASPTRPYHPSNHPSTHELLSLSLCAYVVGAAITTFAGSFSAFMWGRTLIGLGCGCGFMLTPVYIGTS
jgi:hypothetical protein